MTYIVKDYTSAIYGASVESKTKHALRKKSAVIQQWLDEVPLSLREGVSVSTLIDNIKTSYILEEENKKTHVNRARYDVYKYTEIYKGAPRFSWDSFTGMPLDTPRLEEILFPVERSHELCLILLGTRVYFSGWWDPWNPEVHYVEL